MPPDVASKTKACASYLYIVISLFVTSIIPASQISMAQGSGDAVMELAKTGKAVTTLSDIPGTLTDLLRRANCEVREPIEERHSIKIHAIGERSALIIVPCHTLFATSRIFIYTTRYKTYAPLPLVVPARNGGFRTVDWGAVHHWDAAARQLSAIFPTDLCGWEITWRAVYTIARANAEDPIFSLVRIDEAKGCYGDSPWEPIWTAPPWPPSLGVP
jgi:hypothetical protein